MLPKDEAQNDRWLVSYMDELLGEPDSPEPEKGDEADFDCANEAINASPGAGGDVEPVAKEVVSAAVIKNKIPEKIGVHETNGTIKQRDNNESFSGIEHSSESSTISAVINDSFHSVPDIEPSAIACRAQNHEPVATSSIPVPCPGDPQSPDKVALKNKERIQDFEAKPDANVADSPTAESKPLVTEQLNTIDDSAKHRQQPQPATASLDSVTRDLSVLELEQLERKKRVEKLLREATLQPKVAPPIEVTQPETTTVTPAPSKPATKTNTATTIITPQVTPQQKLESAPVVEEVQTAAAVQIEPVLKNQWHDGRPVWAQKRFDVLLFSVSKLTLAVPLVALGQIQKITDDLTPLFGQANWFMGVLPTNLGKIRCVDTALFVMPERYQPEFRQNYRFVITIDGFPWGLAVDEVKQPIQLEPASVNWRGARSQRPWLAGTIKEQMCALIDVPMLGEILAKEDKNQPK